ncbi:MAG TPA: hypothetical protein VF170_13160 [Planctomycetaceae bacterium]
MTAREIASGIGNGSRGNGSCRPPLTPGPSPQGEAVRGLLFTTDGVRGVARNELDGPTAERLATALAAMLWEDAEAAVRRPPVAGFPVVVGYDDRTWSPPLAAAVGVALRRSGCETIDVGLVTGPEFRFAVAHLDAVAGVLATGAGGGPAVAGLDFALAGGRPLSAGGGLDRLASLVERAPARLTRRGGGRRGFDVSIPYEAGLRRHFRAFAPLNGVIGTASPLVRRRLERLAVELPATLQLLPLPRRGLDRGGADEAGLTRVATAVREQRADFGLWIDEDGTAVRALDETGAAVSVVDLARLLLTDALAERPASPVAVDWPLAERLGATVLRREEVVRGNGTAEAMFVSVRDHAAVAAVDAAGRFWLPGPPPACDALVTLARLLRALGGTGEPCSRRLRIVTRESQ